MGKKVRNKLILILAVIAASVYFTFPVQEKINLGLDLKGGMHLILKVETEKLDQNSKADAVLRAIEILRNRIDSLGVGETVIQRQGEDQILVQLPGITDRDQAVAMVGRVAQLEFRIVSDNPTFLGEAINGQVPSGFLLKYTKDDKEPVLLEDRIALSGETITDARVDFDSTGFGAPQISVTFNSQGAKSFAQLTQNNVGRRLAILLDGEVLSAPRINEAIPSGQAQITGQFSFEEASILALALRSGALPAPMHIEEERTIGPLLGRDSIDAGISAAAIGGIAVLIFMICYYLLAGLISGTALFINLLLIFGAMGFLNAMLPASQLTLTLPGIAGIILTLGMAVDANILINERIREEVENGKPIAGAIQVGYDKALKAIIDSNLTSLIAAFMLFQFGSGPIKGFAVTLSIGLAISLFTSVVVTRTIFELLLNLRILKSLPMLKFFSKTNIDFIKLRYVTIAISLVIIVVGLVNLVNKGKAAYGIDFAGGQIQEYRFEKPVSTDRLREVLKSVNLNEVIIQQFDQYPGQVIIRSPEDTYDSVKAAFQEQLTDNSFETLRIEKVGPVVGKALRQAAIMAIIFAMGGILVYVGFRFKHFDFASAGVIALLHDVLITLGIVVMMGRQIDLLVVTALLTIAGYSINDTIIIYDRVRENMQKLRKEPLEKVLNASINDTLSRTILTTLATLLVVVTLYYKGGEVLNTFALCLIVGFIAGTYSTVFIASPVVLLWQKISRRK